MIHEIQAKTLLQNVRQPDPWFGLRYNLNIYRGCQHHCIYCDSRSACYQIEEFDRDVLVKTNAPELLDRELAHKRIRGVIGTGSMSDCYMPLEKELGLTRRVLEVIARHAFGVHIITKSILVCRDMDLLLAIAKTYATVSITITTADDLLARVIEPGAPSPTERFKALAVLREAGIQAGITLMPVLPFITDSEENISEIMRKAAGSNASYVLPAFGMTTRDRQREYYFGKLDAHFAGLTEEMAKRYGERYSCDAPNARALQRVFSAACNRNNILDHIPPYQPVKSAAQLSLGL